MDVGRISARLEAIFDDDGFDRFDRAYREADRKAKNPIRTKLDADVDTDGFRRYDRAAQDVDRRNRDLVRGSGRLRTAFGSLFLGGAGVAAGATALYGLGKGAKFVVDAFGESQQVAAQTNAVLKSTGGVAKVTAKDVDALSTAISKKTGIDDEAISSGQNLLLTFTNIRNEAGKNNDIFNQTTRAATDMATAMGTDVKSAAMQLGKALNDPAAGMTRLTRVGVTFTDAQKKQVEELQRAGKTQDAQRIILRELNKEFGGSAVAAGRTLPGALNKMRVAVGNVAETVGGKLAPYIQRAANFITDLVNGSGKGGRALDTLRGIVARVGGVFRSVFNFVGNVIDDNRASIDRFARNGRTAFALVQRLVKSVGRTFSDTFGSSGTGRDIRQVITVVMRFAATMNSIFVSVARRILPGIETAFRGLAQTIRGIVRVVSGILTGDFGKAWDGVKDIFSGAIKLVAGMLRASTAPFRAAASAAFGAIEGVFTKLPGALLGIGKRAVSSLASGLAGIPGAIAGAFGKAYGFLSNIGRSIADWINANTPFGDKIDVGPVNVRLPALASGGRVGPKLGGGARIFIAGEGNEDEWVISQEGDRRSNIRWAIEALETLTGRRVDLHKGGKGSKRGKTKKPTRSQRKATSVASKAAGVVGRASRGIEAQEDKIARMEREYDQMDTRFNFTEEELLIDHEDGSVTLDEEALARRAGELTALYQKRDQIKKAIEELRRRIKSIITALKNAAKRARTAARTGVKGRRSQYADLAEDFENTRRDFERQLPNVDLDIGDAQIDLEELANEAAALEGSRASVRGPDPVEPDSGADAGSGDTSTAPPTPMDIARAAAAEFASFSAGRAELFGSMGGNFAARSVDAFGDTTSQAAGMRYFGAASGGGSGGGATLGDGSTPTIGKQINQKITIEKPPPEPHIWAQNVNFELQAT